MKSKCEDGKDKIRRIFDTTEYILIKTIVLASLILILLRIFRHDFSGFLADFGSWFGVR